MLCGSWAKESCISWGPDAPWEGAILRGKGKGHARGHSAVSFPKMAEPIDLPFQLWTRVGLKEAQFNHIRQVAPMCRAHWRHLANMIELSVCGSDVALCQITLTTC